jgi:hypothetical protein
LLWKGRQSGPFSVAAIREKLGSGEISRMHQVNFNGRWIVLDEFLEKHAGGDPEAQRRAEAERRELQLKRDFEQQLATERAQQSVLEERLAQAESHSSHSQLLPPPPQQQYLPPPATGFQTFPADADASPRTSGLAIAALVMGLCNFVPFLNFVTWILALVFGHVALSQMKRDPALEGRGMAIAGLVITYFLLLMGLTFGVLTIARKEHLI